MIIRDNLYGYMQVPSFVEPFIGCDLAVRARGITSGTVPNYFLPFPLSNRFQHGLGTMHLAIGVCENNPELGDGQKRLIILSALMHDWGNPCFAHLSEPLLKKMNGCNGESYLVELMKENRSILGLLERAGVDPDQLGQMIIGKSMQPFSQIISGSIDVDNLDNISRFLQSINNSGCSLYNPEYIASGFRWYENQWVFLDSPNDSILSLESQLHGWQTARQTAYGLVYGDPHLIIGSMLASALYYCRDKIKWDSDFFSYMDTEALEFLIKWGDDNKIVRRLLDQLLRWNFHRRVFTLEIQHPSERLLELESDWSNRMLMAEEFALRQNNLRPEDVTIYFGKERSSRIITVPILNDGKLSGFEKQLQIPEKHLIHINVAPEKIRDFTWDAVSDFALNCLM